MAFDQVLKKLGFSEVVSDDDGSVYEFGRSAHNADSSLEKSRVDSDFKSQSPLLFSELTFRAVRDELYIDALGLILDRGLFAERLLTVYQQKFSQVKNISVDLSQGGGIWVLIETSHHQGVDSSPSGIAGFKIQVAREADQIFFIYSKHFFIGETPGDLLASTTVLLKAALFKSTTALPSLRQEASEISCDLLDLVHELVAQKLGSAKDVELFNTMRSAIHVRATDCSLMVDDLDILATREVEVDSLEERSLRLRHRELDKKIAHGDFSQARTLIESLRNADRIDRYIQHKILLFDLVAEKSLKATIERTQRANDNLGLLERCVDLKHQPLSSRKDAEDSLQLLTEIISTVMGDLKDPDEVAILNYVVPWNLARFWGWLDPGQALISLQRIAELCGVDAQVISEAQNNIQKLRNSSDRQNWLECFLSYEMRASGNAPLLLSAAQELVQVDPQRAVALAERALNLAGKDVKAVLHACEIIFLAGNPQRALGTLIRLLGESGVKKTLRAKLLALVGDIWLRAYQRVDLAEDYLEQAKDLDPGNPQALGALEKIYRERDDKQKLAEILDLQIQSLGLDHAAPELSQLKNELAEIHSFDLGEVDRAFELYIKSAEFVVHDPERLAKVLRLDLAHANWGLLYEQLRKHISNLMSNADRARVHVILSRLCREKLHDAQEAVRHLISAVSEGWIDPSSFNYLKESLAASKRYEELANVLQHWLEKTSAERRPELIRELLALPTTIAVPLRARLAIELASDPTLDSRELMRLFNYYFENRDYAGIERALADFEGANEGSPLLAPILDTLIEQFESDRTEKAMAPAARLYEKKMQLAEGDEALCHEALARLKNAKDKRICRPFIRYLIKESKLPKLPLSFVEEVLGGQKVELGRYYVTMARATENEQEAGGLFRKALICFQGKTQFIEEQRSVLFEFCLRCPASSDELGKLRHLLKTDSDRKKFVKALEFQAVHADVAHRPLILEDLALLYRDLNENRESVVAAFEKAAVASADPSGIRMQLIHYLIDHADVMREREGLRAFLNDERCFDDEERLAFVVDRLIHIHQDKDWVLNTTVKQTDLFWQRDEFDRSGKIAGILCARGFGTEELKRRFFTGALIRQDIEMAKSAWLELIKSQTNRSDVGLILKWVEKALIDFSSDLTMEELCVLIVEQVDLTGLKTELRHALYNLLGMILFKSDLHSHLALKILFEAQKENAIDDRCLIPLYFLIKDYGKPDQLRAHLIKMLPKVEKDERLLSSYPLTLQSLKNEYERMIPGSTKRAAPAPAPAQTSKKASRLLNQPIKLSETADAEQIISSSGETPAAEPVVVREPVAEAVVPPVAAVETPVEKQDWRYLAERAQCTPAAAKIASNAKFSSSVEQHMALQVLALGSGDFTLVEDWYWRVWRYPEQLGYSRDGKARHPKETEGDLLNSRLHRLLMGLSKTFISVYREKFKRGYIANKLGLAERDMMQSAKELDWDEYLLRASGLMHVRQNIQQQKIRFYNLPGLKEKMFFEGESRSLFFDRDFYSNQPQSIFFHKVYGILWRVKLGYFPLLHLDPKTEAFPLIQKIADLATGNQVAKVRNLVLGPFSTAEAMLADLNMEDLAKQFAKIGFVREDDVSKLWKEMRRHVLRLQLAEFLDLIGLCEMITGQDLLATPFKPGQLASTHGDARHLIKFAGKLKLE